MMINGYIFERASKWVCARENDKKRKNEVDKIGQGNRQSIYVAGDIPRSVMLSRIHELNDSVARGYGE